MPINFPNSPTTGQTYNYSGLTWVWNGSAWDNTGTNLYNVDGGTATTIYGGLTAINAGTATS